MIFSILSPTPSLVARVSHPLLKEKQVSMDVLRLDLIHPLVSGNKWFKLHGYAEKAIPHKSSKLITFGGAWSNHIHATAAYCQQAGLKAIGLIRGEKPARLSDTLQDAIEMGMELHFLSREDYRAKNIPVELRALLESGEAVLVPEGGYGPTGKEGAAGIPGLIPEDPYDEIYCAAGTGTTMAGIIQAAGRYSRITGISVLKGHTGLENDILNLLPGMETLHPHLVSQDDHLGGYAKWDQGLIDFMNAWYEETSIPTDIVYTGKLFKAVMRRVAENHFDPGRKILVVHSGGLQGNRSLKKGTLIF